MWDGRLSAADVISNEHEGSKATAERHAREAEKRAAEKRAAEKRTAEAEAEQHAWDRQFPGAAYDYDLYCDLYDGSYG